MLDAIGTADLIGIPFLDGGRDPRAGLDCWGLALEVFRRFGVDLPDYRIGAFAEDMVSSKIDERRPFWTRHTVNVPVPSLVVFRFNSHLPNHTGVYLGGVRFIHAREKIGVNIDRIDSPAWRDRIEGFYTPPALGANGGPDHDA